MEKVRVFVDTNVIIESFRIGCWGAICNHLAVETVEKCVEEALTGDATEPGRVNVPHDILIKGLSARHNVTKKELAHFALDHPNCPALDDGELHLLAWLDARGLMSQAMIMLSTADTAAVVATGRLHGLDMLVSLEQMAHKSGATKAQLAELKPHYRTQWLNQIRLKVHLGMTP